MRRGIGHIIVVLGLAVLVTGCASGGEQTAHARLIKPAHAVVLTDGASLDRTILVEDAVIWRNETPGAVRQVVFDAAAESAVGEYGSIGFIRAGDRIGSGPIVPGAMASLSLVAPGAYPYRVLDGGGEPVAAGRIIVKPVSE